MSNVSKSVSMHTLIKSPSDLGVEKSGEFKINGLSNFNPEEYLSIAPSFKFGRSREVSVPDIQEIIEDLGLEEDLGARADYVSAIRYFLESIWLPNEHGYVDYKNVAILAEGKIKKYVAGNNDLPDLAYKERGIAAYETKKVPENSVIAEGEIPATGEKYYYLLGSLDEDNPLAVSDLILSSDRVKTYCDGWANRVDYAIRVFESGKELSSDHEFLDLSISALMEYYPYLRDVESATQSLRELVDKQLKGQTDFRLAAALHKELTEIALELASIKRAIVNLKSLARSKGFELVTEDGKKIEYTRKGVKKTEVLNSGQLFQKYSYVNTWTESYRTYKSVRRGGLGGALGWKKRVPVTKTRTRRTNDTGIRVIQTPEKNLHDYLELLIDEEGLEPIVFDKTDEGYMSQDGRFVEEILDLCELDPSFRESCTLLLPTHDQTLFGDEIVAGYHVIRKPQKGRVIHRLPELFIEESLSYRLRWLGCELGELISSVNLMPGEEREISISTSRTSLREHELKSTSNIETDTSSSYETLTSVEKEFQNEKKTEKTNSWSAKASGSYGAFSGGASASGSSKKTARQFARTLNKVSSKAVSKMRKLSKQEVVARELTREEAQSKSSSTGTIVNPNVGRTLNINFFSVNNVYSSATFLDEFGFLYVSPFELIDGTGIRKTNYFSKERVSEFIETAVDDAETIFTRLLRLSKYEIDENEFNDLVTRFSEGYKTLIISSILQALEDYSSSAEQNQSLGERAPVFALKVQSGGESITISEAKNKWDSLEEILRRVSTTSVPIEPTLLTSPSRATYADAGIGVNEALESYAVDMRKLEVEKQLTEIMLEQASMGNDTQLGKGIFRNVSYSITESNLAITVGDGIDSGVWQVYLAGNAIGQIEVDQAGAEFEIQVFGESLRLANDGYPMALVKQ